tara:strand:- start:404 stop:1822 length:1419 start_codon:yes stop_codon:yes gene_type:complete
MQLDIGSRATINGVDKRWAGQNYGWQTQESYNELEQQGKLRWDVQWMDRFKQNVEIGAQKAYETTINESDRALIKQGAVGLKDGAIRFLNGNGLNGAFNGSLNYVKTSLENVVNGNGKGNGGLMKTAEMVSEASYDVPYDTAKSLGAPEEVAIAAGVAVSLLEPSPIGEAKGVTAASEFISKTGKYAEKVVDAAPPTTPTLQPVPVGVAIQDGSLVLKKPTKSLDNTINPITVSPGWRANPDVKEGVAGRVKGELTERRMRLAEIEANRVRQNAQGSKGANRRAKTLTDRAASTLPDLAGDDPVAYGRRAYTQPDPDRPGFVMDQHHLFGKAQSAPFAQKMDELITAGVAHEDDLVALAEWGKKLEAVMGDRLSNVLNAPKAIHVGEGGIHPTMRKAGLEPKTKDVQALLANAKNADDVMAAFNDYVLTYVKPSQKMAREMTEDYLKRKSEFSAPEQTMMENFLDDLRRRGA